MPLPLLHSIIGVWKTITPNKFRYSTMHIYPWQIDPPIEHRCLQYCYTKLGTSHGMTIYIENNAHIPMAD